MDKTLLNTCRKCELASKFLLIMKHFEFEHGLKQKFYVLCGCKERQYFGTE
jgi:hypothetical protein